MALGPLSSSEAVCQVAGISELSHEGGSASIVTC